MVYNSIQHLASHFRDGQEKGGISMNNFDFYSPTYFAFGKDRENVINRATIMAYEMLRQQIITD